MRIFHGLKFMWDSRGLKKGFRRLAFILRRFGWTPKKQMERIRHYASVLAEEGVRGTFFVPAVIFGKYSKEFDRLGAGNIEWGIHGDTHTDFSRLSPAAQEAQIKNAVRVFDRNQCRFEGFRAPYLKTNGHTLTVIRKENRFLFDSSEPLLWDDCFGKENRSFSFMMHFYRPKLHSAAVSLPVKQEGLLEIPVSLPDDDVLVDREGFTPSQVLRVWTNILETCHKKGEHFVLQLHPERIYELSGTLRALIQRAKNMQPRVWIAGLEEVAAWTRRPDAKSRWPEPYSAALSVTGDIDCVTLGDYFDRIRKW